jgi:hypothetical protein
LLRRPGVDRDLVAIIEKALEPDPARRHRDAGALAADLKAFTSGMRNAVRGASRIAMLVHWARRHRALAGSLIAAAVAAITATALHARTIATDRGRAGISHSPVVFEVELAADGASIAISRRGRMPIAAADDARQ